MDIRPVIRQYLNAWSQKIKAFFGVVCATIKAGFPLRFWSFLLIFGMILGGGMKLIAKSTVTLGYGDYRLIASEKLYDLNQIESILKKKEGEDIDPSQSLKLKSYPACSLFE